MMMDDVTSALAALGARSRTLSRWWASRPTATRDYALALAFTLLAFVAPLSRIGAQIGDLPGRGTSAASVALILGQTLPLAVRTRFPAACLAVAGISFAVYECLGFPASFGTLGLYVALYSAGAHLDRFRRLVALAATGGYVVFGVVLHLLGSPDGLTGYLVYYLALTALWGLGAQVRGRRAQEVRRRRRSAQAAIAAERSRLARELHDVVTHHVTAMVVQADAAQYLTGSPERLHEALGAIGGTGRRAMSDLRFLLGVLEATGESAPLERTPVPGRVPDLVEQTRAGGQPVELVEDGEQSPMAIGARLTAYRVVQESLTNAVKHAAGQPTLVRLTHTPDWTDVEVTTAGVGTAKASALAAPLADDPHSPGVSGGRGLTGLRKRVEMLGGEFAAGPRLEGGFRVHARIPTGGSA